MTAPTIASLCRSLGADLSPAPGVAPTRREISAVHISELTDPTGYLSGGELLLTTGLALPKSKLGCERYARRLKNADISALALGLGPVHTDLPGRLAEACREVDLPLLIVPPPTPFLTITKAYWTARARVVEQHLEDALATQRALVDAASSRDPVSAVLRNLAHAVGGWTATLAPSGEVTDVQPAEMGHAAERLAAEIPRLQGGGAHSAASLSAAGSAVLMFPMALRDKVIGYLAVGTAAPLDATQRRVVLTAVALLSMEEVRRQQIESAEHATRRCVAQLVDQGFADAARHLASQVDAPPLGRDCRVVVVRAASSDAAIAVVARRCPEIISVRVDARDAWFLLPSIPRRADRLGAAVTASDPNAVILISDTVLLENVGAVRAGLSDALDATPAGYTNITASAAARYSELLDAAVELALDQLTPRILQALIEYLRHRGQLEHASRALGIHRNTLRHRMARCRAQLNVDIDDPDVAATVWLHLRRRGLA